MDFIFGKSLKSVLHRMFLSNLSLNLHSTFDSLSVQV